MLGRCRRTGCRLHSGEDAGAARRDRGTGQGAAAGRCANARPVKAAQHIRSVVRGAVVSGVRGRRESRGDPGRQRNLNSFRLTRRNGVAGRFGRDLNLGDDRPQRRRWAERGNGSSWLHRPGRRVRRDDGRHGGRRGRVRIRRCCVCCCRRWRGQGGLLQLANRWRSRCGRRRRCEQTGRRRRCRLVLVTRYTSVCCAPGAATVASSDPAAGALVPGVVEMPPGVVAEGDNEATVWAGADEAGTTLTTVTSRGSAAAMPAAIGSDEGSASLRSEGGPIVASCVGVVESEDAVAVSCEAVGVCCVAGNGANAKGGRASPATTVALTAALPLSALSSRAVWWPVDLLPPGTLPLAGLDDASPAPAALAPLVPALLPLAGAAFEPSSVRAPAAPCDCGPATVPPLGRVGPKTRPRVRPAGSGRTSSAAAGAGRWRLCRRRRSPRQAFRMRT